MISEEEILKFNMMGCTGPFIPCQELHPHSSCLEEVLLKYTKVTKNNSSFYLILHLIPFLLFKAKKLPRKTKKEIISELTNLTKNIAGSLLFMSSFVGSLKAMLCLNNKVRPYTDGYTTSAASVVTSLSLFFESKSRRDQIALFVVVRSIVGYYNYANRRGWVNIPRPDIVCFMLVSGLISLCFNKYRQFLKHGQPLEVVWGTEPH